MSLYTLALFLHVSGDVGIFIGLGVQLLSLAALRRARSTEQVRIVAALITLSDPIAVISALLTVTAGLYMALTIWGLQHGWIAVSLTSIVVFLPPVIRIVIEPRMRAIVTMAKEMPDGPLPAALQVRIHDPVLGTALQTMAAIVFGIVFLMTIKPSLVGSIAAMIVALILGLASGLPLWLTARTNRI